MAKRMLVDATHPEEIRVAVVSGNKLEELDFEIASRKQLKGNIYLAKVTRVEPSLQAAFVEYGGNRHGFLAFSEIHPDYYRIPVADREALLAQERAEAERAEALAGEPHDEPAYGEDVPAEPAPERGGDEFAAGAGAAAAPVDEPPEVEEQAGAVRPAALPAAYEAPERSEPWYPAEGAGAAAEAGGDQAEAAAPTGGEAPAGEGETPESPTFTVETVGGGEGGGTVVSGAAEAAEDDEDVEDARRRRPRPLRSYKIQEVIKRRQILLVQVVKEERGNKGAALTTYLSLPGRYCVLMPNTDRGGGISRKITNPQDRKRLKEMLSDLDIPDGMAVILRTAGMERSKPEIKRDLEYLLRLWDQIRDLTLQSTAPALIYEEANLIKRSIRDLYANDLDEVLVEGDFGYRMAKDFMRMLMPSHARKVQQYRDETIPLFFRYQVETQIDAIHSPVVQLRSGGYIVINQTEALVAIDVNSGRSTKERNIEETALKTNLEAAEEVARQLRLRDLAGLIVIDFIDMEDSRNNAAVERRLKEAMKTDRARIQLGRISPFGLLELSRQRLRPSLIETNFEKCPHCHGTGMVRSLESAALYVLRAIEEEGIRKRSSEITVSVTTRVALYILNQKRDALGAIERRYGFRVFLLGDDSLTPPDFRLERIKARLAEDVQPAISTERILAETDRALEQEQEQEQEQDLAEDEAAEEEAEAPGGPSAQAEDAAGERRRRRRRRRGRRDDRFEARSEFGQPGPAPVETEAEAGADEDEAAEGEEEGTEAEARDGAFGRDDEAGRKRRRRGKRGGRRRRGRGEFDAQDENGAREENGVQDEGPETYAAVPAGEPAPVPVPSPARAQPAGAGPDDLGDVFGDIYMPTAEAPAPVEPAPATAEEPAPAAEPAVAEEPPAKPKRRAPARRKRAEAAAEVEAPPAVVEPPAPVAEEAAKPKRRAPSRRKKAEAAPESVSEPAAPEAAPAAEGPAELVPPAPAAPEPAVEPAAAAAPAEAAPPPAPEPPAPQSSTPYEVIQDAPRPEQPKKGWWNKLLG